MTGEQSRMLGLLTFCSLVSGWQWYAHQLRDRRRTQRLLAFLPGAATAVCAAES